jgi:signal peptidase I
MFDLLFAPLIIVSLLIRTAFFEPFNTPSGSMIPTLLIGDYLFVSKFSYGYSRFSLPRALPLFSGRFLEFHHPERGDVAVFNLPTDTSTDYIKRIVGLPGDKIQMIHGNLFINGQMVPRRPVEDYMYQEGGQVIPMHQYSESLPRGPGEPPLDHPIIKIGDDGPLDNTAVYEVPQGSYFAMGDNRDNSQDSRVMSAVGFIPAENFVGRAALIFFSTDGAATRFNRLFKTVH